MKMRIWMHARGKLSATTFILLLFVVSAIAFIPDMSSAASSPPSSSLPHPVGGIVGVQSLTTNSYATFSTNLLNSSTSTVTFDFNSTVSAVVLFTNSTINAGYEGSWPLPSSFVAYYVQNVSGITFNADLSRYYFAIFIVNSASAFFSVSVDGGTLQVSKILGVSQLVSNGPDNSLQMSDGLVVNPMTCSNEGYTPIGSQWIEATGPSPTCGTGTELQNLQTSVVTPTSVSSSNTSSGNTFPFALTLVGAVVAVVAVISIVVLTLRRRSRIMANKNATPSSTNLSSRSAVSGPAETGKTPEDKVQETPQRQQVQGSPPVSSNKSQVSVCANCGTPLLPGDTFCGKCGRRVQSR